MVMSCYLFKSASCPCGVAIVAKIAGIERDIIRRHLRELSK